jgi:hypothetical protein
MCDFREVAERRTNYKMLISGRRREDVPQPFGRDDRSVDGIDTLTLHHEHPELFNVTDKDGVASWKLPRMFARRCKLLSSARGQGGKRRAIGLRRHRPTMRESRTRA